MSALSRRKTDAGDRRSKRPLAQRFTLRYLIALGLFSAVFVFGQLSVSQGATEVKSQATLLKVAAAEQGHAYRVAELSARIDEQLKSPDGAITAGVTAGDLQQEINVLGQKRLAMLKGDASLEVPQSEITPALNRVFFEGAGLDAQITRYIEEALTVVSSTRTGSSITATERGAAVKSITTNKSDVIEGLDDVAKEYTKQLEAALGQQSDASTLLLVAFIGVCGSVGFGLFRPMARNISIETGQLEEAELDHRLNNERQTFRNSLKETLESADTEEEVLATLGRAVRAVVPDLKAEILLVNATESRLVRGADISDHGAPLCPVESPMGCAAFRRSQTEVYESSRMLNACPKLAAHVEGACSAVCVPLKFRGRALGVLHTTAADAHPPSHTQIERLTTIAAETGIQLGTVRATQSDRLQATTDGLTGLLNRRSLETAAKGLITENRLFSVTIADLDHFKDLNDTYGHEAGDTALKLFSKVLKANLRPEDIAARYGGEEFILVLPDTNIREAQAALERLQISLAAEIERVRGVPFTASWGLTDQSSGTSFDAMVAVADAALYSAKRAGRNCIYVDGEAASAYQELAPDQIWHDGTERPTTLPAEPLIAIDEDLLPPGVSSRQPGRTV